MKETDLTVVDISAHQLEINPANNKRVGDAYSLDFPDNSFDIVFASNLLHHLENPEIALNEMRRVSRKYVIISEPNPLNPIIFIGALFLPYERRARYSTRSFLVHMIKQANLQIINMTYLGGLVMPNGTPEFILPAAFPKSKSFVSFFQVFITEK